jgi:hypothetical protein
MRSRSVKIPVSFPPSSTSTEPVPRSFIIATAFWTLVPGSHSRTPPSFRERRSCTVAMVGSCLG